MQIFPFDDLKRFLRETFFLGATIALVVFAWVRTLFFEVPFSLWEDSLNLSRVVLTSWLIIAGFRTAWYFLIYALESLQQKKFRLAFNPARMRWMIVIAFSVLLYACNAQPAGFYKNVSSGLTTKYNGMVSSGTKMVMNGEELNHADIPLGEKFTIINEGVKGLVARNNKINVGCSLLITDKQGNKMLEEKDLFAHHPGFEKDSVSYLKCEVSTGEPMKWDEEYMVTLLFWDKNGKGRIENKVKIMTMDIP